MVWLLSCLLPLGVSACFLLGRFFLSRAHRIGFSWDKQTLPSLLEAGLALLINLFVALLLSLAYSSYTLENAALAFLFEDVLLLALKPAEQLQNFKNEGKWSWLEKTRDLLYLVILLLELFAFNASALKSAGGTSPFVYSILRVGCFSLLGHLACSLPASLKREGRLEETLFKKIKRLLAYVALASFLLFLVISFVDASRFYIAYPPDSTYTSDNPFLYYNLFQAFLHGHLYLDEVPPAALAELSNPYDPAARSGISYLWDTVYYQGKYYCYYGPSLVITVMFPVYALSGGHYLPSGLFLEVFALWAYGVAFFYLALLLVEKYIHAFDPRRFFFLTSVAFLSSLTLNFITYRWTDWKYQLPFEFGLAFLFGFLALVLQASLAPKKRWWLLTLSGVCYVGVMASRPDLGIGVIIALAPLVAMLKEKEVALSKKLLSFLGLALTLLLGAGLLISYNVLRYGSALEFGQSFQLTIMDSRTNHLSFAGFLSAFVHYLAEPPSFHASFPYLGLQTSAFSFDTHPYDAGSYGTLFYPFFWAVFLLPFLWKKLQGIEEKLSIAGLLLCPLVLAYSIYCLGGVCFRYQLAIWPFFALASLWLLLKADSLALPETKKISYPIVLGVSAISVWILFNLAFNAFDGLALGPLGFLGQLIGEAF
jgi:hypothetical protein